MLPYLLIAILVGGTIWRYRYDKFGWTTRSSQLYESRLLRIGSPLFHFGILFVLVGHIGGLVIPEWWTEAVGVSQELYHFNALLFGGIAGVCTLAGIVILSTAGAPPDRCSWPPPRTTSSCTSCSSPRSCSGSGRPWSASAPGTRRTTTARPSRRGSARSSCCSPTWTRWRPRRPQFQIHALVGMLLFAIWPFTRLVHAFTAPLHYLFRPYIVYRSRDAQAAPGDRGRPRRLGAGRHPRP